jgi:inner membrane protein
MDNFTHSVTGLAVGELIHRALPAEPEIENNQLRRRLLLTACALASNFPDLDLVLSPLLSKPLGYLLHHRGHTHTVLYALPQALLLAGLIWLLWPGVRRLLAGSKASRAGFALALGIGFLLHILMDYLNSYGVHPFHPFDSRWFYGDMVFIVEPMFWVAFGVPMIMTVRHAQLKAVFAAILGGVLLYFTVIGFLAWGSLLFLAMLAALLGNAQRKDGAAGIRALVLAAIVSIGFTGIQGIASLRAGKMVTTYANSRDPASRVLDVSLAAFPANPLCWTFVSVESNEKTGFYRLRRGIMSIAPNVLAAADCPAGLAQGVRKKDAAAVIALLSEELGDLKALRALSRGNCHFNAWLRFARAPLVYDEEAADVRFSQGTAGNFTTIHLDDFKNRPCSRYIPQWDFPRMDLLEPAGDGTAARK